MMATVIVVVMMGIPMVIEVMMIAIEVMMNMRTSLIARKTDKEAVMEFIITEAILKWAPDD
jgi:hypothetical protein